MTNTLIGNKDKGIFLISILISLELEENSSYLFKGLRDVYMSLFTKLLLG